VSVDAGGSVRNKLSALCVVATLIAATITVGVAGAGAQRPAAQPYDRELKAVIADLQDFWAAELPAVYGIRYTRIPNDDIHAFTSRTDMASITECARRGNLKYKDFKGNAFFCRLDGTVNYDNENYFPQLYKQLGSTAIAVSMAHEWGHAIQEQTETEFPASVLRETQADCFSGAWIARVEEGGSPKLELDPGELERGLAGRLGAADPIGGDPRMKGAHGNGFDRVNSFQDGFEGGVVRCAEWSENPPLITQLPFTDEQDLAQQGNAPLREVVPATTEDLDLYWQQFTFGGAPYQSVRDVVAFDPQDRGTLPDCPGANLAARDYRGLVFYCEGGDFVAYDRDLIERVYSRIGDFGVATLIGNAWASAMQSRLGITEESREVGLQADCFTGAWAGSVPVDIDNTVQARNLPATREASFALSPGDLDEVVKAFLVFTDPAEAGEAVGATAFERMEAFRLGFLQDEQSCLPLAG
jgi:predicted metalloprotease